MCEHKIKHRNKQIVRKTSSCWAGGFAAPNGGAARTGSQVLGAVHLAGQLLKRSKQCLSQCLALVSHSKEGHTEQSKSYNSRPARSLQYMGVREKRELIMRFSLYMLRPDH